MAGALIGMGRVEGVGRAESMGTVEGVGRANAISSTKVSITQLNVW